MSVEAQSSSTVLTVRPAAFGFHAEAAATNAFANRLSDGETAKRARAEADGLRAALDGAGIEVVILDDAADPPKPDAVFPNNWVSFHADGRLVLYPMATALRRSERVLESLLAILASSRFETPQIVDLSRLEDRNQYLEGTGSLILDRPRRQAFASLSQRTHPAAVAAFEQTLGYRVHRFRTRDRRGEPIYHTNVVLSLGSRFAVVCLDAVDANDRAPLVRRLRDGRELIEVDYDQMCAFACNLLELRSRAGDPVIALSETALTSLGASQRAVIERYGQLLPCSIPTIERVGGGSVRCMIADIHLPRQASQAT